MARTSENPFKILRGNLSRDGKKVTQREIANRLKKTVTTILNWENDKTYPSLDEVDALRVAYKTTRAVIEEAILEAARRVNKAVAA